jgi:hypothetical protein
MPNKRAEKRPINLPTCRVSETEYARFRELLAQFGYDKPAQLWRRLLTQLIAQNESGHATELPLRFVGKQSLS